jgi:hypothetical protein
LWSWRGSSARTAAITATGRHGRSRSRKSRSRSACLPRPIWNPSSCRNSTVHLRLAAMPRRRSVRRPRPKFPRRRGPLCPPTMLTICFAPSKSSSGRSNVAPRRCAPRTLTRLRRARCAPAGRRLRRMSRRTSRRREGIGCAGQTPKPRNSNAGEGPRRAQKRPGWRVRWWLRNPWRFRPGSPGAWKHVSPATPSRPEAMTRTPVRLSRPRSPCLIPQCKSPPVPARRQENRRDGDPRVPDSPPELRAAGAKSSPRTGIRIPAKPPTAFPPVWSFRASCARPSTTQMKCTRRGTRPDIPQRTLGAS